MFTTSLLAQKLHLHPWTFYTTFAFRYSCFATLASCSEFHSAKSWASWIQLPGSGPTRWRTKAEWPPSRSSSVHRKSAVIYYSHARYHPEKCLRRRRQLAQGKDHAFDEGWRCQQDLEAKMLGLCRHCNCDLGRCCDKQG